MSFETTIREWAKHSGDPGVIHPLGNDPDPDKYWASGAVWAIYIEALLETHAHEPVRCLVDFGCGDGRVLKWLATMYPVVVGMDSSEEMLARARFSSLTAHTYCWDGTFEHRPRSLTWTHGPVDAIVALAVLIHHQRKDVRRIIAGLADFVRRDGLLLLDLPLYEQATQSAGWRSVNTWTFDELAELCHALDLLIEQANVSEGRFEGTPGEHHADLVVLRRR